MCYFVVLLLNMKHFHNFLKFSFAVLFICIRLHKFERLLYILFDVFKCISTKVFFCGLNKTSKKFMRIMTFPKNDTHDVTKTSN